MIVRDLIAYWKINNNYIQISKNYNFVKFILSYKQ